MVRESLRFHSQNCQPTPLERCLTQGVPPTASYAAGCAVGSGKFWRKYR